MPTHRASPRISVNKLGQFLTTARPGKRLSIIKSQKHPPDVIVARYRKAIPAISKFLKNGGTDPSPIADAISRISAENPATDWMASDNANTISALQAFLNLADKIPMTDLTYAPTAKADPILIEDVSISVNPDFVMRGTWKKKKCCGTLKLHFIKGEDNALSLPGQEYVSMLCHEWLGVHGPKMHEPAHALCLSVDVFQGRIVCAPKATTRRMEDVAAACSEIALRWPHA